jgi:hypothetical protein
MQTIKVDTWDLGNDFNTVSRKAKAIAENKQAVVEFEFNGVACLVDADTNLNSLYRDYANAWVMEWKSVGPNCAPQYDEATKKELTARNIKKERKAEIRRQELAKKDAKQEALVKSWIDGIGFQIIPGKEAEYAVYVSKNSNDGYSRAVVDYAEVWAKIMQSRMIGSTKIEDVAEDSQKELGYLGITGFQYGCAVNSLAHFWVYGEALREWHNAQYGVSKETKGVVNPAVLTLK